MRCLRLVVSSKQLRENVPPSRNGQAEITNQADAGLQLLSFTGQKPVESKNNMFTKSKIQQGE